jgi:hypothetical protein
MIGSWRPSMSSVIDTPLVALPPGSTRSSELADQRALEYVLVPVNVIVWDERSARHRSPVRRSGTTRMGQGAACSRRRATLPSSRPATGPRPRVPTMRTSAPALLARSTICCATAPLPTGCRAAAGCESMPLRRRSSRVRCSTALVGNFLEDRGPLPPRPVGKSEKRVHRSYVARTGTSTTMDRSTWAAMVTSSWSRRPWVRPRHLPRDLPRATRSRVVGAARTLFCRKPDDVLARGRAPARLDPCETTGDATVRYGGGDQRAPASWSIPAI